MPFRFSVAIGALLLAATAAVARAEVPHVVASIKPVHSLAAAVMEGIGEPALLVDGAGSPHTYSLRPSDARGLAEADLVFWIGPPLETFLERPLSTLAERARVVALVGAPGLTLRGSRDHGHGDHGHGDHGHEGHGHAHDGGHAGTDAHVWLDAANARAMVAAIADALATADPGNAVAYRANAEAVAGRLDALDAELRARLAPLAGRRYATFHDAYGYLEHRYGLRPVGAVTVSPDRPPSARRLTDLRERLAGEDAVCLFSEPQFEPAVVAAIAEGTGIRTGVLDPLGATLENGPDLYFRLMRGLADGLAGCLGTP